LARYFCPGAARPYDLKIWDWDHDLKSKQDEKKDGKAERPFKCTFMCLNR